jgi:hypothetical protein
MQAMQMVAKPPACFLGQEGGGWVAEAGMSDCE